MTSNGKGLTRRRLMAAGSAALVSPLIFKLAGGATPANAGELEIVYLISDDCIGCHYCFNECPESAIHWGDDKYVIDQDKCVQCGTCAEVCNISAAHPAVREGGGNG